MLDRHLGPPDILLHCFILTIDIDNICAETQKLFLQFPSPDLVSNTEKSEKYLRIVSKAMTANGEGEISPARQMGLGRL